MKVPRLIYLFILLAFYILPASASHIVGGDITYTYISDNQYKIRLVLFVDCFNGFPEAIALDSTASIGLFSSDNILVDTFELKRTKPIRIANSSYDCIIPPSNACVDMYTYEKVVSFPELSNGYYLVFQRCCRNKTITNLTSPDNTGATYTVNVPPKLIENSSAVFKNLPPNFLCAGKRFEFDHSAKDPDGDSLVYGFYTPWDGATPTKPQPKPPLSAPFIKINWSAGYDSLYPFGTNSACSIDSHTGKLSVLPTTVGQFVVGIYAKEYRNGELVGETKRDYQFNVLPCEMNVKASFNVAQYQCKQEVSFQNTGKADSFLWDFGINGAVNDTSWDQDPVFNYPKYGKYTVRQIAYVGNCVDTTYRTFTILNPDLPFTIRDTSICIGDSVKLGYIDGTRMFSYLWSPATGLSNDTISNPWASPKHNTTYTVIKKSNQCILEDTVQVDIIDPMPGFTYTVTATCEGNRVDFTNTSQDAETYSWFIEGEKVSDEASPSLFFPHGTQVKGWMTATHGKCSDSRNFFFSFPKLSELGFTIPNIITPNGDGMNDCFEILSKNATIRCAYELYIYNRWGELVYNNEGSCWDGTNRQTHNPLAEGTYFYVLKLAGQEFHGTVSLVR